MERPRPRQPHVRENLADDSPGAPRHLERGAAREGQQQDPLRARALQHEMRHAMRKRIGLAGPRSRDDKQRSGIVRYGFALASVELFECGNRMHSMIIGQCCTFIQSVVFCAFDGLEELPPLSVLQTRLRALPSALLASLRRGIEKSRCACAPTERSR
jgi:hypothetical protein